MVVPELWKERIIGYVMKRIRKTGRFFKPDPGSPEDPHSYVTAPKRPLVPVLSAAAKAELPDD